MRTIKEIVPNSCGAEDDGPRAIFPRASQRILVGDWVFSTDTASLSRGGESRRLEHRAAKVLEVLCRRRGVPVSAAELIDAVWKGRMLSPNSVSVVIGNLRRALDDDSRHPRYIETIPKRGYRLIAPLEIEDVQTGSDRPVWFRRRLVLAAPALLVLATAAIVPGVAPRAPPLPPSITVALEPFPNETGSAAYDPLGPAVTELVATHLSAVEGVRVVTRPTDPQWRFYGSIVLWNGHPSLALHAADTISGEVLWSAMAVGPAREFPRQAIAVFAHFQRFVRERPAPDGA